MMSFLEIKPEPLGEEVDASHDEHLNERVNDFSKICFDYEDPDQAVNKRELFPSRAH